MKYHFDEKTNQMLKELEKQILEEYDNSPETHVRVNLLPLHHNATSKYYKEADKFGNIKEITINEENEDHEPTLAVIHEATGGMKYGSQPTKPSEDVINVPYYESLLFRGVKPGNAIKNAYGDSIGYHALVAQPGLMNRPEIVLYMPATFSPHQVGNPAYQKFAYGIERMCSNRQNYHLAIANQAMLTAFVLKEMGYDKESAMRHVFPHNFLATNKKDCPARMLYASKLLKSILSKEESEDLVKKLENNIELTSEETEKVLDAIRCDITREPKDNEIILEYLDENGCFSKEDINKVIDSIQRGTELTPEKVELAKEYVPWQVFHSLVGRFLERERFPQELEEKFIYDMDDYRAYMQNPQEYNYSERRKDKEKVKNLHAVNLTNEEESSLPIKTSDRVMREYKYGTSIPKQQLPRVSLPEEFER